MKLGDVYVIDHDGMRIVGIVTEVPHASSNYFNGTEFWYHTGSTRVGSVELNSTRDLRDPALCWPTWMSIEPVKVDKQITSDDSEPIPF